MIPRPFRYCFVPVSSWTTQRRARLRAESFERFITASWWRTDGMYDDCGLRLPNGRSDWDRDDHRLIGQSIQDDENHDDLLSSFL
jgi:hypothetical protein